jgi:hypothetical protein
MGGVIMITAIASSQYVIVKGNEKKGSENKIAPITKSI